MAEITAATVSNLRTLTGVGMMDCKKALIEAGGDVEAAVTLLRERGVAVAAKRAAKEANQGLVAAKAGADGTVLAMVEVNCETDFVARNSDFAAFVDKVVTAALEHEDDVAVRMQEELSEKIAAIGENMRIRRSVRYVLSGTGVLHSYIHMGGKVGVVLELGCSNDATVAQPAFGELARDLCLQVAAAAPRYLAPEDVDRAEIEAESAIFAKQVEGKPANIVDKIVEGKLGKYYGEICLLEQEFVKAADTKVVIKDWIAQIAKDLGDTIELKRFTRYQLGA